MRECAKSGARARKARGGGVKETKRRKSGDYRQPILAFRQQVKVNQNTEAANGSADFLTMGCL